MDDAMKSETPATVLPGGVLLLGAAAASWWLSWTSPGEWGVREGVDPSQAEYVVVPPALPDGVVTVIGAVGAVVALAAGGLLVRRAVAGRIGGLDLGAVLLLVPLPVMAGLWWSIATAPVIGANIGFGFASLVFPPAAAVFLAAAVVTGVLARRRRARGSGSRAAA